MLCIECEGRGNCWYGSRTKYGTCEICGGTGHLNDDGSKGRGGRATPLWPEHDQDALERDRKEWGQF